MTTLILDTEGVNLALPESRKGGYSAALAPLGVDVEMISGRMVRELRGEVWKITYQYEYFDEDMKNQVISVCRKGRREPIGCSFLPPESTNLITSRFWVLEFKEPKFYWGRKGTGAPVPLWGGFSMTLREVKPGD